MCQPDFAHLQLLTTYLKSFTLNMLVRGHAIVSKVFLQDQKVGLLPKTLSPTLKYGSSRIQRGFLGFFQFFLHVGRPFRF